MTSQQLISGKATYPSGYTGLVTFIALIDGEPNEDKCRKRFNELCQEREYTNPHMDTWGGY